MSVIQHRVERLEAIHGKADTVEAVLKSLSREDLELTVAFLRHRLAELRNSGTAQTESDPVILTGAVMLGVVAEARKWAGQSESAQAIAAYEAQFSTAICAQAGRDQGHFS